ncbi:NADH-quinone oxidoreductase subunit M [Haliangium sp.]|uniref:complex I subunit 4 family protein n=1 Tax=Haliangium sp. TaxID=2663208 RepID=UPI003D0C777F
MTPGAWILPAILGLPLCGAILVMLLPREEEGTIRAFGLGFSLATFGLSLVLLSYFDYAFGGFQLVFDLPWVDSLGIHFKTGIDGISLWLVLLTTFSVPIVLLSTYSSIKKRVREFIAMMLVLELGMLGAFVALDLFLFYIFWEVMLIPMYLLIGVWGGHRRLYASIKFVIYTMVGSLLMLAAIFYVYVKHGDVTGVYTTDLVEVQKLILPYEAQVWCFAAFALAFAIKVPLFPLHTWLPDAHVEAPTAGSVILAGVLLKFGIYGFLRYAMPMFPHGAQALAPTLAWLSVAGIIYGALVAFAQEDVKKLVAYSSVSHLGFCMLGILAMNQKGLEGAIYAMLSHGLTTGGLFLAIGVLYERRHTRRMAEYGGLWAQMPVFAGMFLLVTLGSAGLPGLSGFVGEFLSIFGAFTASEAFLPMPKLMGALAATGVILGAVYLLYMFQKVMFGPITRDANRTLKDLSGREIAVFVPLVVMIFVMGVYPRPFLQSMEPAVEQLMNTYRDGLSEPDGEARLRGAKATAEAAPSAPEPTADLALPAAATGAQVTLSAPAQIASGPVARPSAPPALPGLERRKQR